jgi:hypothetical protein
MSRFSRHTISVVGVSVIAFVFSGAVGASSAVAALAPGYGPLGESGDPGISNIGGAGDVAVDDATANVLFADPYNDRVFVMAPDLTPGSTAVASVLTQFNVVAPGGIAIDQSTHAVYVNEGVSSIGTPGGSQIERFVSDGAPTPTYTADPSFVSPILQHYGGPLAIDPTTHDLLVGDVDRVNRYTAAGVFVGSFDGASSPGGAFTSVTDIAVGATKTYVINLTGDAYAGGGVSRLAQFDAHGVYERTLTGTDTPVGVAVDVLDRPVVVGNTAASLGGAQLATYDDGVVAAVGTLLGPNGVQHFPGGVAADRGASGRIYVSTTNNPVVPAENGDTGVSALVLGPGLRFGSATAPVQATVHLTGTVNPEGGATTARFEYCSLRDACATNQSLAWQQGPDVDMGAGSADVPVVSDIAGLLPHTSYRVRLAAIDGQTTVRTPRTTVVTADAAPLATTGPVSDLSSSDATVTGAITPLGIQSTYYFEYGEATAYGSRVPVAAGAGIAGNGFSARSVSRKITGLKPGTLYHYRIVGVNSAGSAPGADRTLATTAAAVASRGYEMVTPVDKQGIAVDTGFAGTRTSPDGNALLYGTAKSPLPGAQAAVFVPRVLGARSAHGWTAISLEAPLDNLQGGNLLNYGTLAVSANVRSALVLSKDKLVDGGVQGGWNLYIRTPGAEPEFTLVASDPLLAILGSENSPFRLVGVSDDLRTTVFTDDTKMYEAVAGQGVTLVSRMPDNSPATLPVPTPSNIFTDVHQVSADGSRIYFNVGSINNGQGALYLRQNGTTTVPISVSQRPGAPSAPVGASLLGASADGRYVEFSTACGCAVDGLTPSAPDGGGIYRYDVVTGGLTFLAAVNDGITSFSVPRPERNAILFETAHFELNYSHAGAITKIADLADFAGNMRGSDSGRYYAFVTTTKLTSYDNTGQPEVYLYDADTGDLSCASCRTDGGPANGSVQMASPATNESVLARYKARVVLDDGTVFFDTTEPLVGADVNGTRDVYVYRDGRASLISRGTLPTSSQFVEVTADGANVFFNTDDQLVGQDKDTVVDMYDARIGGGIADQSPKSGPVPCAGSECREAGSGPVSADASPSESADQAAPAPEAGAKTKVTILSSSLSSTTLRLVVQASVRGRIRVSGDRVTTTSRAVTKAGKYTLKVPLSRKTRLARKAHRKVTVAVKVALTPPFGATVAAKLSRTLGK